jgi:DNA-binding LacI/PurR family transcriptional regulator
MYTPVKKGQAYVVIEETDLVNLVKICRNNKLRIGKDVGIVSYNETLLKEILLDGITVISTDHEQMGITAAQIIMDKTQQKVKNPFRLILRNSL